MTSKLTMAVLLVAAGAVYVACAAMSPAPGPSVMVAGWDFSPYPVDGALTVDAQNLVATFDANYSDLDPTSGAGAESAAFGTLYLDGRFGSTKTPLDFDDPLVPSAAAPGSLSANLGAPAGVRFDCFKVLKREGQGFAGFLTMTARAPVDVVFGAELGSVSELGRDWSISFAGRSWVGSIPVHIDFSTDGSDFRRVDAVTLTEADALFRVELGAKRSKRAYVRLRLEPHPETTRYQQAFIDNVAIHAKLALPPGASPAKLVELSPSARECR